MTCNQKWRNAIRNIVRAGSACPLFVQRSNLLTREICYSNHLSNGVSFRKHILSCLQNTFCNAPNLAFLLGISQGIRMVAETFHITFVIHKLLFRKIRNSRNLKKTFEHRFIETLWHFAKGVSILEYEKHPIKVAFTLPLGFVKPSKADINQTHKVIVANLWMKFVLATAIHK